MKRIITFLLLSLSCLIICAQDPDKGAYPAGMGDYHSPDVQALNRYGQIPVSYFTGTPQISIPLYETDIRGFKLGISLSYNSSGIKVDDIASSVGLGWVLNAGGVISRSVRGIADETPQRGFLDKTLTSKELSYDYYLELMFQSQNGLSIDCSADEFTYNFMGYSGKFSFGTDKKIHLLPFNNLKFEFVDRAYFKVTTEDGNVFLFKDTEKTTLNNNGSTMATSAWHLTKIILNNNKGEIDFSYVTGGSYNDRFPVYSSTKTKITSYGTDLGVYNSLTSGIDGTHLSYNYIMTDTKYLSEIKFPTNGSMGKIIFEYDNTTLRQDFSSGKKLINIQVYNSNAGDIPIKKWTFNQRFLFCSAGYSPLNYGSDQYRMFLDRVTEILSNQMYQLEYNQTLLPCRKTFGKDLWGYYNGKYTNPNAIYINDYDRPTISSVGFPTTGIDNDRKGNDNYIKAGVLTKLIYPTGGYSSFEYEGHQISFGEKAGGLRIKSIKNYTENVLAESRDFTYGQNENGLAKISTFNYNKNLRKIRAGYSVISPYITSGNYNIYSLDDHPFYSSSIGYEFVTEYFGGGTGINGKKEYRYDFKMDDLADSDGGHPNTSLFISNSWQNGEPKEVKTYTKTNNGFDLIKKEVNAYSIYQISRSESYCVNLLFSYSGIRSIEGGDVLSNPLNEQLYSSTLIPVVSEIKKPIKRVVTDYIYNGTKKDSIIINTLYSYNGLENVNYPHDFTTNVKIIKSVNDTVSTEQRYLTDIITAPSSAYPVYKAMYERNMISTPLEIITKNKSAVIKAQVNLFRQDASNGNIIPTEQKALEAITPLTNYRNLSIASSVTMDSRLSTNVIFTRFNSKGNLSEYSKSDGINTVVLWGYNNQYPIARIIGATYDDVKNALTQTLIDNLESSITPDVAYIYMKLSQSITGKPILVYTYTYKPLIGMLTSTDPSGITTYYDYDSFGRLKETYIYKDGIVSPANKQIIQSYGYHYQNQ